MARPKTAAPTPVVEMPVAQVEKYDAIQHERTEQLGLILRQFGDGLPFDPTRYEVIIRDHLARSASEALAAGRALIVVREALPHGEWIPFIERVGLEESLARRMMQAAFKFSDEKTAKLVSAAGNKTKLFELMVLDDEEISELADGGTVAGIELDDIQKLPSSKLRAMVRDYQEEKKATEKLLADKNNRIDNLAAELQKTRTRIEQATVDEQRTQANNDVSAAALSVQAEIVTPLRVAIERLLELDPDAHATIAGHVTYIQQALDTLREEFALGKVTPSRPEWSKEP